MNLTFSQAPMKPPTTSKGTHPSLESQEPLLAQEITEITKHQFHKNSTKIVNFAKSLQKLVEIKHVPETVRRDLNHIVETFDHIFKGMSFLVFPSRVCHSLSSLLFFQCWWSEYIPSPTIPTAINVPYPITRIKTLPLAPLICNLTKYTLILQLMILKNLLVKLAHLMWTVSHQINHTAPSLLPHRL